MFSLTINSSELNEALETDGEDRCAQDWHMIELAAEKWLEAHPANLCDCERSANGIGLAGRECDCPAGVRNSQQTSDGLLIECRDELDRLLFNQAGAGTAALIKRINDAISRMRDERAILRDALTEARRFMDYFANGRREFVGPGTPLSCLAHIDWALNPNAAPEAPESRSRDGADGGTEK